MNNLLKFSLIAAISIHITGCSLLDPSAEIEYIIPVQDVSLSVGESTIVHGAIADCGQETRFWSDISIHLPISETGFFSNAGRGLIKSKRCGGTKSALKVRFTANKVGSESLTIFGDPLNIVVSDKNAIQQSKPNPERIGTDNNSITFLPPKETPSNPINTEKTEPSEGSMLGNIFQWIDRDVTAK